MPACIYQTAVKQSKTAVCTMHDGILLIIAECDGDISGGDKQVSRDLILLPSQALIQAL